MPATFYFTTQALIAGRLACKEWRTRAEALNYADACRKAGFECRIVGHD